MAKRAAKKRLENRLRWIIAGVLTLLLGIYLTHIFLLPRDLPRFDDFIIYRNAGLQTLKHQSTYLPTAGWQGEIKYKYAPFLSLVFGLTIGQLPLAWGEAFSYVLNFILWMVFVKFAADHAMRISAKKEKGKPNAFHYWIYFWLFFAIFGMALRDELKLGQINVIPLLLLWIYFKRPKPFRPVFPILGGLLLSVAIQFKLYSMVAMPFLIYRRQWKTIGWTAGWVIFFNLVVLAPFHGISFTLQENLRWIVSLTQSSAELIPWPDNTSILSVIVKWTHSMGLAQIGWVLFVIAYLIYQYFLREKDPLFNLGFMFCMILPITPIAWPYWILFAAPVFFLLVADEIVIWKESVRRKDKTFAELFFAGWVGILLLTLGNAQSRPVAKVGASLLFTLILLGGLLAKEHRLTKRLG